MPDRALGVVIDFPSVNGEELKLRQELMNFFADMYQRSAQGKLDRCGVIVNITDAQGSCDPYLLGMSRKDLLAAKNSAELLSKLVDHLISSHFTSEATSKNIARS